VSQPYNTRVVVQKTPNALLKKYLSAHSSFHEFDWAKLSENDTEPILTCLRSVDADERHKIGKRFRQVHALASPTGTATLTKAGERIPGLAKLLESRKNAFERAFWCLVEHPDLFDSEIVCAYTYSLPKTSRETRAGFPAKTITVDAKFIELLKSQIGETYKSEERAQLCTIDHTVNDDGVHVIHAYPSDYEDEMDSYESDGKMGSISVRPPFHLVFFVDCGAGKVSLLAKGGADKHDELFERFSRTAFGVPPPPRTVKKTYDLSLFKDPNLKFEMVPEHHFRKLRVTAMRIHFLGKPRHRARFEVDREDPHDDIYGVLSKKLRGGLAELAKSSILNVDLQAIFASPGRSAEKVEFSISTPRWCTLGDEGAEGLLRQHLQIWKIESDGKDVADISESATSA
jgi:hypothetical protein